MNDLGAFISRHREDRRLSVRRLAELANVSHTEIHRLESGFRKHPSPPVLKAIANALGVNYDDIMRAAGYITAGAPTVIAARLSGAADLTEEELDQVRDYIDFLRSKRRQ